MHVPKSPRLESDSPSGDEDARMPPIAEDGAEHDDDYHGAEHGGGDDDNDDDDGGGAMKASPAVFARHQHRDAVEHDALDDDLDDDEFGARLYAQHSHEAHRGHSHEAHHGHSHEAHRGHSHEAHDLDAVGRDLYVSPSSSSASSSTNELSLDEIVQLALDLHEAPARRASTGLVYHEDMLKHFDPNSNHPERPERLLAMYQVLARAGLVDQMTLLTFEPAPASDLLLVHVQSHLDDVESLRLEGVRGSRRFELEMRSAFSSEGTVDAAYLAAGGVVRACEAVLNGEVVNALCLVRPPGHHAEHDQLGGFCFFNSVAVAAAVALSRLGARRVVVVDWDVHHGNGIQHMFYQSDQVLYISVHRWHYGNFYPGGSDGGPMMTGAGRGSGYNINVGWLDTFGSYGDAEILKAWDDVVMPACRAFDPDLVLVSAGFDAARGDPLGGCDVTPAGYGHLLYALMSLADGKVVVALEGGYSLTALAGSGLVCAQVLVGQPPPRFAEPLRPASSEGADSIKATVAAHAQLDVVFSRTWTGRRSDQVRGDEVGEVLPADVFVDGAVDALVAAVAPTLPAALHARAPTITMDDPEDRLG